MATIPSTRLPSGKSLRQSELVEIITGREKQKQSEDVSWADFTFVQV